MTNASIDFGDDSGAWLRNADCDDLRFEGRGKGIAIDRGTSLASRPPRGGAETTAGLLSSWRMR